MRNGLRHTLVTDAQEQAIGSSAETCMTRARMESCDARRVHVRVEERVDQLSGHDRRGAAKRLEGFGMQTLMRRSRITNAVTGVVVSSAERAAPGQSLRHPGEQVPPSGKARGFRSAFNAGPAPWPCSAISTPISEDGCRCVVTGPQQLDKLDERLSLAVFGGFCARATRWASDGRAS